MNLDDLKKTFDRVAVCHFIPNGGPQYKATHAALAKGGKVYVGVANCCHNDQFSRRIGRQIALGRALFEYKVDVGEVTERPKTAGTRRAPIASTPEKSVDRIIDEEVFLKKSWGGEEFK